MYFSVVKVQPHAGFATLSKHSWSKYSIHRVVWSLFVEDPGEKTPREFLYREDVRQGMPIFYIVSQHKPNNSADAWDVETKEYTPVLTAGQRLGFSLRANPTMMKDDENGKRHRHSIIKEAIFKLRELGIPREELPAVAEVVQYESAYWLGKKGKDNGFKIEDNEVVVKGYRDEKFYKPKGRNTVSLTTVDLSGVLTVTDPEAFTSMLYSGIGSGKGFGCGLMLVRPI